jgi:hypothetical protein
MEEKVSELSRLVGLTKEMMKDWLGGEEIGSGWSEKHAMLVAACVQAAALRLVAMKLGEMAEVIRNKK